MPKTILRRLLIALAAAALLPAAAATARKGVEQGSPKVEALVRCSQVADPAQRLACFDAAVAPLATAIARKEVLIIDRSRAEAANRSLFGYGTSGFGQFLGIGDVDHIESTVASSGVNRDGGVIVTLADGSRWSQQDDKQMFGDIRKGTPVTVARGMLGSYVVRIKGQIGFKAVRIQ